MSTLNVPYQKTNFKVNPTQFTLYIFLVSVAMIFAGLTSGYIVRKAEGNWLLFDLPGQFFWSNALIIGSSLVMFMAQWAHKKARKGLMQISLLASLVLGGLFVASQFEAWQALTDQGIYLVGNPSGSFLFVISGVHLAHVGFGLFFILIALMRSFVMKSTEIIEQRVQSVGIYWHFMGLLWIYLYLFLSFA